MKTWKKTIVYRSKNEEDWNRAKLLLQEAGIESYPFAAQEAPMAGCGVKIDPRKFLNKQEIPSVIFRIEVSRDDREQAEQILRGKVQPVLSYGYSI